MSHEPFQIRDALRISLRRTFNSTSIHRTRRVSMFTFRRQPGFLSRSLVAGRNYSNAPTAPGVTGAAHTPKPGSPIASANPTEADPENLYQAPNHPSTWSTSQNPKKHAFSGPRFEQVNFSLQPQPISAMARVAEDPVRLVPGRKATCDGGMSMHAYWKREQDIRNLKSIAVRDHRWWRSWTS